MIIPTFAACPFAGGRTPAPSYQAVSGGFTGHAESVEVLYDPKKVSYSQLLDVYWHQVKPIPFSSFIWPRNCREPKGSTVVGKPYLVPQFRVLPSAPSCLC